MDRNMVMEIQCTWAPRMLTRIVEYGTRGSCLTAVLVRLTQEMDGAPHRSTDMDRHAWFSILCHNRPLLANKVLYY